jgi:hypothetical protein
MSTLQGLLLLAGPVLALIVGGLIALCWNPHKND